MWKRKMFLHYQFWHWFLLQSLLDQALKEAPYFVCSFDESYNSTIKKRQMDMIVMQTLSQ